MRSSAVAAVLAPAVASAQWWAGAPACAQSCLSSAFGGNESATSADWPSQTDYCDENNGNDVGSCLSSSCSATSTAWSSYQTLSSSLCSQWSSCTSAGSTGVHTITVPSGTVTWGAPGGWPTGGWGGPNGGWGGSSGGPNGGPVGPDNHPGGGPGGWGWGDNSDGGSSLWSQWASAAQQSGAHTWTGGVFTVTGCVGDGSPWFAGPGGGWNNYGGFNGWVGWGSGWSQGPTSTATITYTTTVSGGSGGDQTTVVTGLATVAAAVSGDVTTTQTMGLVTGSDASASSTANAAAAPLRRGAGGEGSIVTGMCGLGLGLVVGIALIL
ncbi:hypothetical protein BJ166DRAFT_154541 [Pestalotiopsis sp. NC0098]|nr:hypothetical protein BJ166DRAFT_154541 [Pestalotiopsis sp. NC0098]